MNEDQIKVDAVNIEQSIVTAVIEIPAGTHLKREYNKQSNRFEVELVDRKPREVAYLPYPVNYGYVISTLSDSTFGGDGDPIDVMVLSKQLKVGQSLSVLPLATMHLIDMGEIDDKVLAIPVDTTLRVISCVTWECIQIHFPSIPEILTLWYTNYKGKDITESTGWSGTDSTMYMIRASTRYKTSN